MSLSEELTALPKVSAGKIKKLDAKAVDLRALNKKLEIHLSDEILKAQVVDTRKALNDLLSATYGEAADDCRTYDETFAETTRLLELIVPPPRIGSASKRSSRLLSTHKVWANDSGYQFLQDRHSQS